MQINFKANYIDEVPLKYGKKNGSFVELNPRNITDLISMHKVADSWDTSLAYGIVEDAMDKNVSEDKKTKFYAITRQIKNFEKLNPDTILGIAETRILAPDQIKIHFLQINPLNKKEGLGSSIIKFIQSMFPEKDILVHPMDSVTGFYSNLGFKPMEGYINWILKRK